MSNMKQLLSVIIFLFIYLDGQAKDKEIVTSYPLAANDKITSLLVEVQVTAIHGKREALAGLRTNLVELTLESDKKEREFNFHFPKEARVISFGEGVEEDDPGELEWDYPWELNTPYQLMISTAGDSTENFSIYSAYIFLPKENQWKWLATCRIAGEWKTIQEPATWYNNNGKKGIEARFGKVWGQRSIGGWKNLLSNEQQPPIINFTGYADSAVITGLEIKAIEKAIAEGKTDAKTPYKGLFYSIIQQGSGAQVAVSDTVEIFYKGYLFEDDTVFDETTGTTRSFPLNRLIVGWQIGLPLCKVGSKIKLVIPSHLAYGIRTRSPKIPPGSTLVFEIEVVNTKSTR